MMVIYYMDYESYYMEKNIHLNTILLINTKR